MADGSNPPFCHLVVDTNAIIAGAQLRGLAQNYCTVAEALSEIRDSKARQALQLLPFKLETRAPSDEAVNAVREFATKTGDIRSISRTDLLLLALTYQLEKQENGASFLRSTPRSHATKLGKSNGFGDPRKAPAVPECKHFKTADGCKFGDRCRFRHVETPAGESAAPSQDGEGASAGTSAGTSESYGAGAGASRHADGVAGSGSAGSAGARTSAGEGEGEGEGEWQRAGPAKVEEAEEDEGEWIGPSGDGDVDLDSVLPAEMRGNGGAPGSAGSAPARRLVACITTDFAMQNVLLQQGMLLATHSGKVVTSVKQWVLKCDACFAIFPASAITTAPDALFCKRCGNATLARLGVTLGADGTPRYHYKHNRRVNTRGTVYALPAPKGGRLQDGSSAVRTELLLRPDQLLMGAWQERVRQEAAAANRDSLLADSRIDDTMLAALGTSSGRAAARSGAFGGAWLGPGAGGLNAAVPLEVGWGRRNPNSNRVHKHKGKGE